MLSMLSGCSHEEKDYSHLIGSSLSLDMDTMSMMGSNNYDTFIKRRFITVYDDEGILQYIKVDNNIPRHSYDWNNLIKTGNYWNYGQDGIGTAKIGVDVSKHQGNIDWAQVAGSGIEFAMIRLGYRGYGNGAIVKDEFYDANMTGATANGIPVGVYFYTQATSYEEGVEEANFVLQNLGDYPINYPIVFDTEDADQESGRVNGVSVEAKTDAVIGFCETIKAAGYNTMVYANKNWLVLDLQMARVKDYDIWYAQYAEVPDFPYNFKMWQYTAEGQVPGISTPADIDIYFQQ